MRWWMAALAAPLVAVAAFAGWLFAASEALLHHRYTLSSQPTLPPGEATRGAHLAAVYGCTDCHGDDLRGRPFPHPAPFAAVTSANLTRKTATYSDADFARVIREGMNSTL